MSLYWIVISLFVANFIWRRYMWTYRPEQFSVLEERRRERTAALIKTSMEAGTALTRWYRNGKEDETSRRDSLL
jgi:hypothetical protein